MANAKLEENIINAFAEEVLSGEILARYAEGESSEKVEALLKKLPKERREDILGSLQVVDFIVEMSKENDCEF